MTLPAPVIIPPSVGGPHAEAGPVRTFMRLVQAEGVAGQSYQFPELVKSATTISLKDQARIGVKCTLRKEPGTADMYRVYFTKLTAADLEAVKAKLTAKADDAARTAAQLGGAAA